VVAIGIMAAFAAVSLILQGVADKSQATTPKPALVSNRAHAAHAGGD
jgi:hypothetical protein